MNTTATRSIYQHSLQVLQQEAAQSSKADGPVPGPDFVLRFAALMHEALASRPRAAFKIIGRRSDLYTATTKGAKLTAKRMKALRFDDDTIEAVARLVELRVRFLRLR